MMMGTFSMPGQRGFTLIEVLMATALSGMVAMAAYTVFSSSNWSANVQQDVSQTQQNVRAAMDRVAKDVRAAGFGLPDPPFSLTMGTKTFSAPVEIDAVNASGAPDTLTVVGVGEFAGTLVRGANTDCNQLTSKKICLSSGDKFMVGGNFKSERRYISIGGEKFIQLSTAQPEAAAGKFVLFDPDIVGRDYLDAQAVPVFILQAITYSIATDMTGCSPTNPCLVGQDYSGVRDGLGNRAVYSEGIEDLQLAYLLKDKTDFINNADSTSTDILAVRLNLVAKTPAQDPKKAIVSRRICLEDLATNVACNNERDGYRRRALSKVVMVRNPKAGL